MTTVRIFSYQNSPRVYKSTIAARYSGTNIEFVGGTPKSLANWLWDYNARELSNNEKTQMGKISRDSRVGFSERLYKTDEFMQHHPFGTVPAAFTENGNIGFFESNSIMRAVARIGPNKHTLYGTNPIEESIIDGFLDRTLVFAVSIQKYLLSGRNKLTEDTYRSTREAVQSYFTGIEQSLINSGPDGYIAGKQLTLADIAFACEICLLTSEGKMRSQLHEKGQKEMLLILVKFKRTLAHLHRLLSTKNFFQDLGKYKNYLVTEARSSL